MIKSFLNCLPPLKIGGSGASMPFSHFLWSVFPLILASVWAYAILVYASFNEVSGHVLIGTTVLPFIILFSKRSDDTLKAIKEFLTLCWWGWTAMGFLSVFSSLATGTSINANSLFASMPLELQAVLFGLFGSTLFAQLGLSLVLVYRQMGGRIRAGIAKE